MRKRPGETRSSMWFIFGTFAVQSCRGQVVRRRILRIRARLSGRVKQPIGGVERLNRMTPYAFRRSPCRMELLDAMTIHVLANRSG